MSENVIVANEQGRKAKRPREALKDQSESVERFVANFEKSSRRWEIIVYPALFAFVILAAYGFYLVFNLAQDMRTIASSMNTMTSTMVHMTAQMGTMQEISEKMDAMHEISKKMDTMEHISDQLEPVKPMLDRLTSMNDSMRLMTFSNHMMQNDVGVMSRNMNRMAGPMNMMSSFMP